MAWDKPRVSVRWLVNQTPFDGCLLVFNAEQSAFRAKVSDVSRMTGIKMSCHSITGSSRTVAHAYGKYLSDLYITIGD